MQIYYCYDIGGLEEDYYCKVLYNNGIIYILESGKLEENCNCDILDELEAENFELQDEVDSLKEENQELKDTLLFYLMELNDLKDEKINALEDSEPIVISAGVTPEGFKKYLLDNQDVIVDIMKKNYCLGNR